MFEFACRQFYPELGPYSSRDATVIAQHFRVRTFCFPSFSIVSKALPCQDMADRCLPPVCEYANVPRGCGCRVEFAGSLSH